MVCCSLYKTPISGFFTGVGLGMLIYGAWVIDWNWIILAIIIAVVGFLLESLVSKKKQHVAEVKKKKRR